MSIIKSRSIVVMIRKDGDVCGELVDMEFISNKKQWIVVRNNLQTRCIR